VGKAPEKTPEGEPKPAPEPARAVNPQTGKGEVEACLQRVEAELAGVKAAVKTQGEAIEKMATARPQPAAPQEPPKEPAKPATLDPAKRAPFDPMFQD
jgi:hypothetical protein